MNKKKNILYLEANEDGTIGGSHYCLLEIVKKLDKNKYVPYVCFYQHNTLVSEFEKYSEVQIIDEHHGLVIKERYPVVYSKYKSNILLNIIMMLYQKSYNFIRHDLYLYIIIINILRNQKIDLVHINDVPTLTHWLVASKIVGIKCISHMRGNPEPGWVKKKLIRYYDKVISISNSVTEEASKKRINTDNFITIHDGIDVNAVLEMRKQDPETVRTALGISSGNVIVGDVGNIKDWKGQHVVIEAVYSLRKKYPAIKCLLVGAVSKLGVDREYYNTLVKLVRKLELEDCVIFTGFRENIPDIISIFDVMVHTSTEPEPLGRVILEGMLLGKPVVATAHGGPLEIIEDKKNGFLVKPSDPLALANTIDSILEDMNSIDNISINAKKRVDEYFDIDTNVKKTESLYSELLIN